MQKQCRESDRVADVVDFKAVCSLVSAKWKMGGVLRPAATFLLARRGWKDVCRKQSKCCRTSPAATEVAVQCRDSAQQQNRSLER